MGGAEAVELGRALVRGTLPAAPAGVIAVDAWANPATMPGAAVRRAVFDAAGLPLLQEKEGFLWRAEDPPTPPPAGAHRLAFRSVDEAGRDLLATVMGRATRGTLDRQDRYYAALVGEAGWGREMLGYLTVRRAGAWRPPVGGHAVARLAAPPRAPAGRGAEQATLTAHVWRDAATLAPWRGSPPRSSSRT